MYLTTVSAGFSFLREDIRRKTKDVSISSYVLHLKSYVSSDSLTTPTHF
jgi:hypothetical protein